MMEQPNYEQQLPLVLVVDDMPTNIEVLRGILRSDYRIMAALNGERALEISTREPKLALILLDVMMPGMDGYEVCRQLKSNPATQNIPVIFVTARDEDEDQERGFDAGAVDYIPKPVRPRVVLSRVRSQLAVADRESRLEEMVKQRTSQLEATRRKLIQNLGHAAEFKDNETGMHVIRMSYYAEMLAKAAGQPPEWTELLFNASPMHDVDKIGIPDHILCKPGKLTPEEWTVMQTHTTIGARIIGEADGSELLAMATTVALTHHERWDGTGYPNALAGEAIPLEGRIVAIAEIGRASCRERVS
jgi:putative two-component system response regulator